MKALVTGGGGFLGRRIVELLRERGDEVVFTARGKYPAVEACGAVGLQVDLRDLEGMKRAMEGVDVVFHVAALARVWGDIAEFEAINVQGTKNVLEAMRHAGVKRLVYTSTPSVCASGEAIRNGGMDVPYAEDNDSPYGKTKLEAEKIVKAANGPGLATVSLRPRLIFGPREDNILPNLMNRARAGRLMRIGDGSALADLTYIDNAAWAHLDAERALVDHTAPCAGMAYFITNGEPVALWPWVDQFFAANGIPPVKRSVSVGFARRLGAFVEWVWRTFRLSGEPRMTKQIATAMGTDQFFDMSPAYRDLGYRIRVPMETATKATHDWFVHQRAEIVDVDGKKIVYEGK